MVVAPADLGVGNARMMAGRVTINQMAGPPIGAALFAAGMIWPFLVNVVFVLLGASLISRVVLSRDDRAATAGREPARQAVAAGVRWLWHHPPVRTLALTILTFNVTFGAAWSVLVLYAADRLGLGEVGFGTLTTIMAAGGTLGVVGYGWLERHLSLANIMRTGLIIETFTHLTLALTTTPAVAFVTFFVFGAHAFVWGTTSQSVRQRAVPTGFQGRVSSVYLMCVSGGLVIGAALGGVLADAWGLTAPFWFAFVGSAIILVLIWPHLGQISHATAELEPSAVTTATS
jgi:predicted MFS family arabinose efflux permease